MRTHSINYFLYLRKSTDDTKRQVLSIKAQRREVREFATREGLHIVAEFEEHQSAKIPGRPVFNQMLERIERGEACAILAWHPDRLTRNDYDSWHLSRLLENGKLLTLKFPTFAFENNASGRMMLSMGFNFAKYYVDALSENTKRGLREKVHRGEYPGPAPIGYLNDYRTKLIILDRERAPIVKRAFEMYATGEETLDTMRKFFGEHMMLSENQKLLGRSFVARVLTNPFYYGHFRYAGEIYEGRHEALITKKVFDEVQAVLKGRARTSPQTKKVPKVFLGLLHCAECGGFITAEIQKGHTYYRCTKKNRIASWCTQPYVREEALAEEIKALLAPFCLSEEWAAEMLSRLKEEEHAIAARADALAEHNRVELEKLNARLQRLLDSFLDGIIDREAYVAEKARIMSNKKSLEEQRPGSSNQPQIAWVEPMKMWVNDAQNVGKTLSTGSLQERKSLASKIFGSNLFLDRKKARGSATKPWSLLLEPASCSQMVRLPGLEPVEGLPHTLPRCGEPVALQMRQCLQWFDAYSPVQMHPRLRSGFPSRAIGLRAAQAVLAKTLPPVADGTDGFTHGGRTRLKDTCPLRDGRTPRTNEPQ